MINQYNTILFVKTAVAKGKKRIDSCHLKKKTVYQNCLLRERRQTQKVTVYEVQNRITQQNASMFSRGQ